MHTSNTPRTQNNPPAAKGSERAVAAAVAARRRCLRAAPARQTRRRLRRRAVTRTPAHARTPHAHAPCKQHTPHHTHTHTHTHNTRRSQTRAANKHKSHRNALHQKRDQSRHVGAQCVALRRRQRRDQIDDRRAMKRRQRRRVLQHARLFRHAYAQVHLRHTHRARETVRSKSQHTMNSGSVSSLLRNSSMIVTSVFVDAPTVARWPVRACVLAQPACTRTPARTESREMLAHVLLPFQQRR
jgi:hypothetical protein